MKTQLLKNINIDKKLIIPLKELLNKTETRLLGNNRYINDCKLAIHYKDKLYIVNVLYKDHKGSVVILATEPVTSFNKLVNYIPDLLLDGLETFNAIVKFIYDFKIILGYKQRRNKNYKDYKEYKIKTLKPLPSNQIEWIINMAMIQSIGAVVYYGGWIRIDKDTTKLIIYI